MEHQKPIELLPLPERPAFAYLSEKKRFETDDEHRERLREWERETARVRLENSRLELQASYVRGGGTAAEFARLWDTGGLRDRVVRGEEADERSKHCVSVTDLISTL